MIEVSGLFIYPIKSLQGIEVHEAKVLQRGFECDRRWMIIDIENKLVTQRTHPQLFQIQTSINEKVIRLEHPTKGSIEVPISIESGDRSPAIVWNDTVDALLAEKPINEWFSQVVGMDCRLVFMPKDGSRPVKPVKARNGEHVSFADGYPYLVIGEASLEDLNSRMEKDLPMNRFRPNIVVKGTSAYEEDSWVDFNIGDVPFYQAGKCKRCVFTTIDQQTGEKGVEPLKTLASYRREGSDVVFGLNSIAAQEGVIRVGDALTF